MLGPFQEWNETEPSWRITANKLPAVVHACLVAGWHIEAEGKVFRRPGEMRVSVASGVDWFELHGEVEYGGIVRQAAGAAGGVAARREYGPAGRRLLWPAARRMAEPLRLAGRTWATPENDHIRFQRNQVGLLDALLAAQPEISCDETFTRARDALRNFEGIRAPEQPAGFIGQLRDYQREGVGWMEFLRARSASAAAWPTIWAWARPRRCWRCWKTAARCALPERQCGRRATLRRTLAGGGAEIAGVQLEAGGRALHAATARARPHRPGPQT